MIRHTERVGQVTETRAVEGPEFFTIEVDYVTEGGVRKTLALAHNDADMLRARLVDMFETMEPETRKRSFMASIRRKR
jgi:hypothetical protein